MATNDWIDQYMDFVKRLAVIYGMHVSKRGIRELIVIESPEQAAEFARRLRRLQELEDPWREARRFLLFRYN